VALYGSMKGGAESRKGNCSRTSLVSIIARICIEKVTSGFVPEFHLADWNEAGCFGS